MRGSWLAAALLVVFAATTWAEPSDAKISHLKAEYLENPLGIDILQPRLSWRIEAAPEHRGWQQSAYQILVATSPNLLSQDQGDLWDSTKITSPRSIQIPYGGTTLKSFQVCWWKVRSWDEKGIPTPWSEPASRSMGVLNPSDWRCNWIEFLEPMPGNPLPLRSSSPLK